MSLPFHSDHPAPQDPRQRMEFLLQRFFERQLDAAESRELDEIWQSSPELLDEACRHQRVEHLLHSFARLKIGISEQNFLSGELQAEKSLLSSLAVFVPPPAPEAESVPIARRIVAPATKKIPEKKQTFYPAVLAFAVVALLGTLFFLDKESASRSSDPRNFRPFARVEAVGDVRWSDETEAFKTGQELESKRIRFDSGLMEIELKNGVRIALQGPVDFQLTSEKKIFCNEGRLSVTVPKSGKGFEVATPLLNVIDQGTEFSLNVQKEFVETHTITGRVELNRLPTSDVALVQGNAFRLTTEGKTGTFEADPRTFLAKQDVQRVVRESDRRKRERWKEQLQRWNVSPSLLLHFDFEQSGRSLLNVSGRHGDGSATGRLFGGRAVDGRWNEKKAIAFAGRRDYIELDLPRPMRSATLFASIRLDRLDRYAQVVLASRDDGPGSLIWQLGRGGSVQLSIQPDEERAALVFTSQNVIFRPQWNTWFQLATVVDAENGFVAHFFDGREIQRFPMRDAMTVRIGEATVGNGFWKVKTKSDRSLDGRIDQLMVFDRALNEEEIRQLSQNR